MDKLTYLLFRQIERGATSPSFSALEQRFPRIALRLVELWQSLACGDYLRSLLIDDRGDRQGFPAEVVEEIILLDSIHWSNAASRSDFGGHHEFRFAPEQDTTPVKATNPHIH